MRQAHMLQAGRGFAGGCFVNMQHCMVCANLFRPHWLCAVWPAALYGLSSCSQPWTTLSPNPRRLKHLSEALVLQLLDQLLAAVRCLAGCRLLALPALPLSCGCLHLLTLQPTATPHSRCERRKYGRADICHSTLADANAPSNTLSVPCLCELRCRRLLSCLTPSWASGECRPCRMLSGGHAWHVPAPRPCAPAAG